MIVRDAPASPPELADVIAETKRQICAEHTPPRLKRDAHPKMHGCVQGILTRHEEIPGDLKRGVFSSIPDDGYKAWVRFSNAFRIQHDLEFETRGMAIKLLEVAGERPLPEAEAVVTHNVAELYREEVIATSSNAALVTQELLSLVEPGTLYTQDFVFATHDAFFLPNPSEYLDFLKCVRGDSPQVARFYGQRLGRMWRGFAALILSQLKGATSNPLSVTYNTQTPYRLGEHIVKLQMRPEHPPRLRWFQYPGFFLILLLANVVFFVLEPITKRGKAWAERFCDRHFASRDFLRLAMMRTLAVRDATFVLEAQRWDGNTELNDASLRWTGRFDPIARLRVPTQAFWPQAGFPTAMSDAMQRLVSLGENMSFNPWHGLAEHEPLGSINEARRWIYRDIARFRRDANHIDPASMPRVQWDLWHELKPFIRP